MEIKQTYSNYSIAIADDAHFIRFLVKKHLRELNFGEVFEAESGRELMEIYRREEPALVIMDIIMHEWNGLRTLDVLKSEYPEARVIILSAVDVPDILQECIDQGISDFIVKPFQRDTLLTSVIQAMNPGGP